MSQNKNSAAVKRNKLFKGIPDSEIKLKYNQQNFLELKEGEIIYQKGEESSFIYLIIEGEVKIKFLWTQEQKGVVKKLNNEFFGDDELLAKSTRRSSAVALTDCMLYKIGNKELEYISALNKPVLTNLGLSDAATDLYNYSDESRIDFRSTTEKIELTDELEKLPAVELLAIPPISIPEVSSNIKLDNEKTEFYELNIHPGINKVELFKQELLEDPEDDTTIKFSDTIEKDKPTGESTIPENDIAEEIKSDETVLNYEEPLPEITDIREEPEQILPHPQDEIIIDDEHYINIHSGLNLEETLNKIVQTAKILTDADQATIFLSNLYNSFKGKTLSENRKNEIMFMTGIGLTGLSAANNEIIIINDAASDKRYSDELETSSEYKVLNTMCYPLVDETGHVICVIQLFNSMKGEFSATDKKKLNILAKHFFSAIKRMEEFEKVIQSSRLSSLMEISNFLISDIKIPILTIKHYAALLKKQNFSTEVKNILDMLTAQANSVVDVVQTTFEFTQDKKSVIPVVSNLVSTLEEVLIYLSEYVESRNVKLFKKIEGDAKVEIDKRTFYQACFQIAKNACDAMPGGGNIYITCSNDDEYVRIDIKDEGPGIPAAIQDILFDPFVTYDKPGGTGIGLSIAKKLITELNGNISVQSNLGEGSTFIILLPVVKD